MIKHSTLLRSFAVLVALAGAAAAEAQVTAASYTGSADVGVASQPVANVAANDTVAGAPATLGSTGNATLSKVGTWTTGLGLDPSTGAISTTKTLPVGSYTQTYQICQKSAPTTCAQGNVTVNVINQVIVANPVSGTADFNIGSQPIANVTATDTINGAAVVLGTGGNGVVAQSGTWPTGIMLNGQTGTISTSATLPVGTYPLSYQLCDLNVPKVCSIGTATVTVITSTIIVQSVAGTATAGVASLPIPNVIVAGDSVNGAVPVLGPGGNAVIAAVGTWPPGIVLNTQTGAVTTTTAVGAGTYAMQFQLCDLNTPKHCMQATATVTVTLVSVVANPESGTADYGIGSLPIANVTANDSINGQPVVLGAGGNGIITQYGTWNSAIILNTLTGAVSVKGTLPNGTYQIPYQLCDYSTPKNCAVANDTLTIITASILANPVSGIAAAGVASTPIANVVTSGNDSVNGVAAVLGTGGNAQLTSIGNWPTGINLYSATGAVTVASNVAPATYNMQYELCDLNVPANCAVATVEITVTPSILANPQNGVAVAGKNSTAIANIVSNDTINGKPARLQNTPNATVASSGTWPAGIALNTTTGAVTVASTVAPGNYTIQYVLCAIGTTSCSKPATDTITVDSSVIAVPLAGSSVQGTAGVPLPNIVQYDLINGAPVNLNPKTGNAKVSAVGTWPAGIVLNTKTGAVTTTATVPLGNNQVQYQLCDRLATPTCATAPLGISITAAFVETPMSTYMTGDLEFDWGRDGLFCAACNYGSTNAQVNWTDRNNNLWVSGVDPVTGNFTPISGRGTYTVPVDTTAAFWQDWGNGPEWAFSTPPGAPGGMPVSSLVYTRYAPGQPPTWEYVGSAVATQTGPAAPTTASSAPWWSFEFFPGAYTAIHNTTVLPEASQCPSDTAAYAVYENLQPTTQMFTEQVNPGTGQIPQLTPFGYFANGIGERFVPCTTWLTFQGDVTIGNNVLQQVFWYDRVTQNVQQLTFDPTTKQRALMFRAPEFGGAWTLMALSGDNQIQIYRQNGTNTYPSGAPQMQLVNTIHSPDPGQPWMFDPKTFIHCTAAAPTCQTYIVMGLSPQPNSQQTETIPNGFGVTSIDPTNPFFEVLVNGNTQPLTQRLDPKYYITQNGPIVYYSALIALSNTLPYQDLGIYSINMNLGPPAGPCVGSSAHEGLNPTWPNCTAGLPPGAPISSAAHRQRVIPSTPRRQ